MDYQKRKLIEALRLVTDFYQPNFRFPKCVICKDYLSGLPSGNSPSPIRENGKCCNKCYHNKVVPAQLHLSKNPAGSWRLQELQALVQTTIQHFPHNWKEVVNEDASLFCTFRNYRRRARREKQVCIF